MSPPSRPRAPRLHLLRAAMSCSILAGTLACEDRRTTAGGAPEGEAQDSAGIRIVSHRLGQPAGSGALVRALDTIPELKVGVAEGDSTLELAGVVGAVLLDDGRLAIGLRGNSQVRLYGTAGVLERRMGRRGSGPGEFRRIAGLWRLADGDLAVDDAGARLISVFDTSGALRRSISYAQPHELDTASRLSGVVGFVADGLALGIAERHSPSRTGVSRPLIDLVVLDSPGRSRRIAGPYPGTEMFLGPPKGGFALMATPPSPAGASRPPAVGQSRSPTTRCTRFD